GTGRGGRRGRRSVAAPRGRGYGQDKDPRSSQRVQGARTVMATTTGGFSVPEAAPALRRLRDQVRGQVLEPGTPGYDGGRAVWHGLIGRCPLVSVRAASEADIPPGREAARETGLPRAVRGAGHSNAGLGRVDDGIVLDLGGLCEVSVGPATRRVTAGPVA